MENIEKSVTEQVSIEKYLEHFKIPTKTLYQKKKPLLIESDDDGNDDKKKKRKKIVLEKTVPISPEKFVEQTNKKPSRKIMIKGETKNKSKKKTRY